MAQLTITIDDAYITRIRAAFARRLMLPVAYVGLPEVQSAVVRLIRDAVFAAEKDEASETAAGAVTKLTTEIS